MVGFGHISLKNSTITAGVPPEDGGNGSPATGPELRRKLGYVDVCREKKRRHTREQGCQRDSRGYPVVLVVRKVALDGIPCVILEHVTEQKMQHNTKGKCEKAKGQDEEE